MTTQLEGVLAGSEHSDGSRIAAGLAKPTASRRWTTWIASLEEREQSLTHAADSIAPGLAGKLARLAELVSGVEIRIATLLEREHSLTRERIGPGLAEADRLTAVVSGVENGDRQPGRTRTVPHPRGGPYCSGSGRSRPSGNGCVGCGDADRHAGKTKKSALTHAADRIAPGLAEAYLSRNGCVAWRPVLRRYLNENTHHPGGQDWPRPGQADRLAAVVSGVETRIATLEEREQSLTHAADRIAPGLAKPTVWERSCRVETRIATLILEREHERHPGREGRPASPKPTASPRSCRAWKSGSRRDRTRTLLTETAERIAAGLTEADRLAAVVVGRGDPDRHPGRTRTRPHPRGGPDRLGLAEADRLERLCRCGDAARHPGNQQQDPHLCGLRTYSSGSGRSRPSGNGCVRRGDPDRDATRTRTLTDPGGREDRPRPGLAEPTASPSSCRVRKSGSPRCWHESSPSPTRRIGLLLLWPTPAASPRLCRE